MRATGALERFDGLYRVCAGRLDAARLLHEFVVAGALTTAGDLAAAAVAYAELVAAAPTGGLWGKALQQQIFLGDDAFIARMQALAAAPLLGSPQIPLPQRSMPLTLAEFLERCETREEALIDDGPPEVRPQHGGDGG